MNFVMTGPDFHDIQNMWDKLRYTTNNFKQRNRYDKSSLDRIFTGIYFEDTLVLKLWVFHWNDTWFLAARLTLQNLDKPIPIRDCILNEQWHDIKMHNCPRQNIDSMALFYSSLDVMIICLNWWMVKKKRKKCQSFHLHFACLYINGCIDVNVQ